jgi:hypothetical protein
MLSIDGDSSKHVLYNHDDIGFIRVRVSVLQSWLGLICLFFTFYSVSLEYSVLDLGLHTNIH